MKKILIINLLLLVSRGLFAQQIETAAIKQTVNTLFDAMRKGDSILLRSVFSKDMILHSISNDREGKAVLAIEKADDFVKAIGTPHTAVYDERIVFLMQLKLMATSPPFGRLISFILAISSVIAAWMFSS